MKAIPYGRQQITEEDIQEVVLALQDDYLTQGPRIDAFEKAFADYIGATYAIAVSNGTAALHLAVLALGIAPGDKVITTPITFAASANCVAYAGGEVVFADIDPATYLLDPMAVRQLLEAAPKGTYKGIIPVDFAGRSVNMQVFAELADEFGLWIIEDACHAPGATFTDHSGTVHNAGNGKWADCAVFSFHPVKHIATGEGGMITTDNKEVYDQLRQLRTHGITRDASKYKVSSLEVGGTDEDYPGWYMEMQELGYNYRITDIQAALGNSQLKRAATGIIKRREIAARYAAAFQDKPWVFGQSGVVEGHAYHLYIVEVDRRLELYNHLRNHRIFAQIHYIPCHLMPFYRDLGWQPGDFPLAERYYKQCLSLPMYPSLTEDEQTYVIQTITDFYA